MSARTTLVLGGTGKTGRRVAERLRSRGLQVRIGSRSAEVPFDWNQSTTWEAALANVSQVYISYYPDLAIPGTANLIRSLTEVAVARGVKRVALPAGSIGEPFVDADDIAGVAVASLTDDRHAGKVYEVTGPRLWTFAEAIAEIARVTGRDIRFTEIGIQEYTAALEGAGAPREVVALITYLFSEVLDGRNASIQDGVQRALGRPPRDFSAYVRNTAATGVWSRDGIRLSRSQILQSGQAPP